MLYICQRCWKFFEKKSLLDRHMKRKTPCTISCKYCNAEFSNKESIIYHTEKKVCRNFKLYYCELCDMGYHHEHFYISHMKNKHSQKVEPEPHVISYNPTVEELFS